MTDIAISPDDKEKIDEAQQYLQIAQDNVITDEISFTDANNTLKQIKAKKNEFDGMRKSLKKPINAAAKAIEDFFRQPISFLGQAESIYKVNILKYQKTTENRYNETNAQNMIKAEELTANALDALKANDHETYATLMDEISKISSKTLTLAKTQGVSFKDNWKGRVTDMDKIIQAVIDKKIPSSILKIDDSTLNQLARSTKNTIQYPGIEFYNDKIVSVKAETTPC